MNSKPFPSPQGRVLGALTHLTVVAATVVLFSGCVVSRVRPARSVTVVETAPTPQRVVVVRDPPGPGNTVVIVKDAPPPRGEKWWWSGVGLRRATSGSVGTGGTMAVPMSGPPVAGNFHRAPASSG